jgi:hypothetical protein
VAPVEIVELEEAIEVTLDFVSLDVPRGSAVDTEALVEQSAVHALDEAIGPWGADAIRSVLDVFHGEQQLDGM